MTNTVTNLNRPIDCDLIQKLFSKFSKIYGHLWSSRCSTPQEWLECAHLWVEGLHGFSFVILHKAVTHSFLIHKDHPPTLGQMVSICLHFSGVPTESEVIELMIAREFTHPIIKHIYNRIGSWTLSHAKPHEIKSKVHEIYAESLMTYQNDIEGSWKALEAFKSLASTQALPKPKSPRNSSVNLKEWLSDYRKMSDQEKSSVISTDNPVFDVNKVNRGHKDFDKTVFDEYRKYLTGVNEKIALTMSRDYQYDRITFLREELARQHINSVKEGTYVPPSSKSPSRAPYGAKTVYKDWMSD